MTRARFYVWVAVMLVIGGLCGLAVITVWNAVSGVGDENECRTAVLAQIRAAVQDPADHPIEVGDWTRPPECQGLDEATMRRVLQEASSIAINDALDDAFGRATPSG